MEKWELVADKFLKQYVNEDYFLGAILTGSYATGNNDVNSDIDIFIITNDSTPWRERGNKLIDGYMIEYFINPVRQILKEFDEGFKENGIATTFIFAGSKILYDTDGIIENLVNRAKHDLNKDLESISEFRWKMNCYGVWHSFYELNSKYIKNEDIEFTYNLFLNDIIKSYFLNEKIPLLPVHKIEKILKDEEYRKKYNVKKLSDDLFIDKLLKCFSEKDYDKKYNCAKELYDYYMDINSDFDINNFSFRSDI